MWRRAAFTRSWRASWIAARRRGADADSSPRLRARTDFDLAGKDPDRGDRNGHGEVPEAERGVEVPDDPVDERVGDADGPDPHVVGSDHERGGRAPVRDPDAGRSGEALERDVGPSIFEANGEPGAEGLARQERVEIGLGDRDALDAKRSRVQHLDGARVDQAVRIDEESVHLETRVSSVERRVGRRYHT